MRILMLTPGTGSFHCGSCLRDHDLCRALRARGHDARMVPLYLPVVLDRPDAELNGHVELGGVNMYLQQVSPAFRWIRPALGWLDRPGLLRWASTKGDMTSAAEHGAMTVSTLRGEHGRQRAEIERLVAHLRGAGETPDVVMLSNAMLLGLARRVRSALGAPIVCTLQGEQPFLDAMREPHRTDAWTELRERGAEVDAFVGVSRWYGALMAERLGLPAERLHAVPNGIDLDGFDPPAERTVDPPVVGYFARLCRDKGLETLIDAFIALRRMSGHEHVRLVAGGAALPLDLKVVAEMRARLDRAGAAGAFEFHPNVSFEQKLALLRGMTVFSAPAHYGESFGLYVAEAMAMGLPVVQPRHGGFTELVEETGGGLLCAERDPDGLALCLAQLLEDRALADELSARGRAAVHDGFTSARMAERVERILVCVIGNA